LTIVLVLIADVSVKNNSNCPADTQAQLGSLWRWGRSTHLLEFGGLRRHRPRIRRPRLRHVYKEIIEWIPDPCSVCGAGATTEGRFGDLRLDQFSGLDNDICRGSAMDEGTFYILQAQ